MSEYDSYSPQLRTALVLSGVGTAGAYHAGVLRALHEAGVKIDVVAGRGIGVVSALFVAVGALAVSVAIVAVPLGVAALGLLIFPLDFVLKMIGIGAAGGLVQSYL